MTLSRRGLGLLWLAAALLGCDRASLGVAAADAAVAADAALPADAASAEADAQVSFSSRWQVCATLEAVGDPRTHHAGIVTALAASRDGRWLASYAVEDAHDPDRQVWIWQVQDGRLAKRIKMREDGAGLWLDLSPDGELLAAAGDGRAVYRVADGSEPWDIPLPDGPLAVDGLIASSISFSPDGATVAVGGWGTAVTAFRSSDGQLVASYRSAVVAPSVALSPDGRMLATSAPELVLLGNGARLQTAGPMRLEGPSTPGMYREGSVEFSPDGQRLLVSRCTGFRPEACTVSTWVVSVSTGAVVADLGARLGRRPRFSPNGAWAVGGDKLVNLADLAVTTLPADASVSVFLSDGRLAAGGSDGWIRLLCPSP